MPDYGYSKDSLRGIVGLTGEFVGTTDTLTLTNKTYNTTDNTLTATSQAAGDILKNNGTKFVRLGIGAAGKPWRSNDAGTDGEYNTLGVVGGGTGVATHTAGVLISSGGTAAISTKANPSGALIGDTDVQNFTTGRKTFFDQIFGLRNPANTFTLTFINPAITADSNYYFNQPYKYLIFRDNTNVYCRNQITQQIESSAVSSSPQTPIQYALDNSIRSAIYIQAHSSGYNFPAGFTGLTVSQQETTLIMDTGTLLTVPNGYTGSLFIINDNIASHITGGRFSEAGTPSKLWDCFYLHPTGSQRVSSCSFSNMYIRFAKNAFHLHTDTNSWINRNNFRNILIDNFVVAVLFEHTSTYTDGASGSNSNSFEDMTIQAIAGVTHGFKDVNGRRNMFKNCYPADFTGGQITMNISANARNTHIIGGTCTFLNFADLTPAGSETWIRDEFQGDVARLRKTYAYHDWQTQTAPGSPASGYTRLYPIAVDGNNDALAVKEKVNGSVVEVIYT